MTPTPSINRSHTHIIIFLGILNALTPFTIDLYLPAFGDIAADLSTTVPKVSLSIATYFVGFALGQIIYGPLLDRFGRKLPLYGGLVLYILATVGCMTAKSVEALWVFRFLSALGGCASSVGALTMVRDFFKPEDAPKVFSMLMLVLSVSPLFAPSIGGWMAAHFGWRSIFGSLVGLATIILIIVAFGLPKKYEPDPNIKLEMGPIFKTYLDIFKIPQFRTYVLAGALSFSGLFVYLTGSPAIFIEGFQVSKEMFGLIFALLATAMIGGGQVNNFLLRKLTSETIFQRGVICQIILSGLFLFVLATTTLSLVPTIVFFFLLLSCIGIAYPNSAALALKPLTKNVGSASALLGFVQMGAGAGLASMVGLFDVKGSIPTAAVIFVSSILAGTVLWVGARWKKT